MVCSNSPPWTAIVERSEGREALYDGDKKLAMQARYAELDDEAKEECRQAMAVWKKHGLM